MARSQRAIVLIVVAVLSVPLALAAAVFVAAQMFLRTDDAADLDPAEAVNIRIHNGMDDEIDRLWLGRGIDPGASDNPTFLTRYTDIPVGADSGYQTVEHHQPNYEGVEVVIDDVTYLVGVLAIRPLVADLEAGGYYTIVLDQQGDQAVVTEVTNDPAPS